MLMYTNQLELRMDTQILSCESLTKIFTRNTENQKYKDVCNYGI